MQSVGETSLPSRSVTATVVSKTYRRTRDNRALSTQACAFSPLQGGIPVPELRSQQGQHPKRRPARTARPTIPTLRTPPLACLDATALSRTTRDITTALLRLFD
jgi:hypothetical protein